MKRLRLLAVTALCGLTWSTSGGVARSAEEYERFLAGLRGRGYFDAALDYLAAMRASPLLSDDQKMMVPFEEARTFLEASRSERDNSAREKLLDGARDKFKEFADRNSAHPQAAGAVTQLGAVLVERGRAKLEQGLAPQNTANRKPLMEEARKFFDEAEKVFQDAEKKFDERLATYPKFMAPNDPRVAEREKVKGDLIQAHMFHAYGLYEKSRTYDSNNKDEHKAWETALRTAADKYGAIYKDYRTLIAGLAARLKEGQCYQELKDTKRALGLYADLLGQPNELKALRPYKASAMYLSLQCWTSDSEKMYELAYRQGDEFLKESANDELQSPEWLAVRYFTALAHKLRYSQLPEKPAAGEETKEKQFCYDAARQNAEVVASTQNEYQDPARALLKDLLGSNVNTDREPKSFLEAQNRGMDSMNAFSQAMADREKAADEATRTAKEKEALESRQKANDMFYKAIRLADENTTLEDINTVRYYLCYLAYTENRAYDAAVLGEFLLKNYPNSGGARQAAQIALASYVNEYQAANGSPVGAFDRLKMQQLAAEIAKRWKGEKEADDAWNILLAIAMNEKRIPDMLLALDNIQLTSPIRAEAEMKAGRSLWSLYQEQLAMDEGAANKLSAAEMQDITVKANKILGDAIKRQVEGGLDSIEKMKLNQAETQMFLCESLIALGKFPEALQTLEDPKIGLLTLVRGKDKNAEATQDPIPLETYKLALQAYVLNDKVDKAQELIPELDALGTGGGGDQKAELANTYLNLALRLEKQIEQQRQNKNLEALKAAAKGFAFFLGQIENAGDAFVGDSKFQNLNWVSENYFRLGSDLVTQTTVSNEDRAAAKEYFSKSAALDDKLAPLTKPDSDAQLIVKLRKARAMRRAGNFVEAIGSLTDVLRGRRNLMEAQMEAAETYMDRAATNKEPNIYTLAVNGGRPDEKGDNIIWGWHRIAKTMQGAPPFADVNDASHKEFVKLFHQARYNVAWCAYMQGMAQTSKDERDKHLKQADYAITITEQYTPDMGGEDWKPKYDELKKKVQSALKN